MSSTTTVTADLRLPLFKQGDDLAHHLEQEKHTGSALRAYAQDLRQAARLLETLAKHGDQLTINADTHWISVSCPTQIVQPFIESGLMTAQPDEDDE